MTASSTGDEPRPPDPQEAEASSPAAPGSPPSTPDVAHTQGERAAPGPIPRTRVSATFIGLICGLVVLVLLLVFILENTRRVPVTFFGATGHLPLGVALLLAAVAGAVVLGVVGLTRILQIRRGVRRTRR